MEQKFPQVSSTLVQPATTVAVMCCRWGGWLQSGQSADRWEQHPSGSGGPCSWMRCLRRFAFRFSGLGATVRMGTTVMACARCHLFMPPLDRTPLCGLPLWPSPAMMVGKRGSEIGPATPLPQPRFQQMPLDLPRRAPQQILHRHHNLPFVLCNDQRSPGPMSQGSWQGHVNAQPDEGRVRAVDEPGLPDEPAVRFSPLHDGQRAPAPPLAHGVATRIAGAQPGAPLVGHLPCGHQADERTPGPVRGARDPAAPAQPFDRERPADAGRRVPAGEVPVRCGVEALDDRAVRAEVPVGRCRPGPGHEDHGGENRTDRPGHLRAPWAREWTRLENVTFSPRNESIAVRSGISAPIAAGPGLRYCILGRVRSWRVFLSRGERGGRIGQQPSQPLRNRTSIHPFEAGPDGPAAHNGGAAVKRFAGLDPSPGWAFAAPRGAGLP